MEKSKGLLEGDELLPRRTFLQMSKRLIYGTGIVLATAISLTKLESTTDAASLHNGKAQFVGGTFICDCHTNDNTCYCNY